MIIYHLIIIMSNELHLIIQKFNELINETHLKHYINNINELIDNSDNASPNQNIIYHFYSNGQITYQKGAWAYLQRSEFEFKPSIPLANQFPFKFMKHNKELTYVILTKDECIYFREIMINIMEIV